MNHLRIAVLALSSLLCSIIVGQEPAKHASVIELIVNPTKFDGTLVTVEGYLLMSRPKHDIAATVLYLHREDADNRLGNSILVVPSKEMERDREKINEMYVTLTGRFHAVPATGGSTVSAIKEIVACTVWSDPDHPIGRKQGRSDPIQK
jgi:hypothetical protein